MSLCLGGAAAIESCLVSQALSIRESTSRPTPSTSYSGQQSISPPVGNGALLAVRGTAVSSTACSTPVSGRLGHNDRKQTKSCIGNVGSGARQQQAEFRVSTKAARAESPTLARPTQQKRNADDLLHWDGPLQSESGFIGSRGGLASTSGDGRGGGVRERFNHGSNVRDCSGAGPLPWFSHDLPFGGLFEAAPLNAASVAPMHHRPTEHERGWVELHTDSNPFLGRKVSSWHEFGNYDLDEARVEFQTLQGMLQGLRLGRTKIGRQRGLAEAQKEGGLAAGHTKHGRKRGSVEANVGGGVNGRLFLGAEKRTEGVAASFKETQAGSRGEGGNGFARTGVKEPLVNGVKTLGTAGVKQVDAGAHTVSANTLCGIAIAEASSRSRMKPWDGSANEPNGNGHFSSGKGFGFSGRAGEAFLNGRGASGTEPQAGNAMQQEVVGWVREASAGTDNGSNGAGWLERHRLLESGGTVLADEKPLEGEELTDRENRTVGKEEGTGQHSAGVVSNGRAGGRSTGAWRTKELARGQWVVKVVTPVRKREELGGSTGHLPGEAPVRGREQNFGRESAGREEVGREQAGGKENGRKGNEASLNSETAHSGRSSWATSAATGPDREAADEAAAAAVVSAVTSLLRTEGSVTFGRLGAVLEPWVGKVSQRTWDRVFGVLERENESSGVLAVLGWMVGRQTGTEPDLERALSGSGAASVEDEGNGCFGNGSSVEGAEALDQGLGSRLAVDDWDETAESTGERGRSLERGNVADFGGAERIRIDAQVLEGVLGDRACSCRICASLRGGQSFAADGFDPFGGVDRAPNETPDWVWRENVESQSGGGVQVTGAGTPPKRRLPSLITRDVCVTAVRALAAAGRVSDAAVFLTSLDGTIAGQNLRKALIMQLARDRQAEEALCLLRSCSHRGVLLYNVVMDACSKAWLGHERVVALFDRMVADGLMPSVRSCNIVLSALVRENMLPEASRWMDEMRVIGCKPDAVSYNTLLGARVQFKAAREVFDQMCREGVAPNLRTFNVLIAALAAVGDYQEALTWLQRMKGMRIEPSEVTYNSLITACLNGGSGLDEALSVVDMMEEAGFGPDVVTFNILIGACSRFGWLEEREELLEEMKAAGIPANEITQKMIALHRPEDLERGFRKRFEVHPVEERQVVVVEKRNRRPRGLPHR